MEFEFDKYNEGSYSNEENFVVLFRYFLFLVYGVLSTSEHQLILLIDTFLIITLLFSH